MVIMRAGAAGVEMRAGVWVSGHPAQGARARVQAGERLVDSLKQGTVAVSVRG